MTDNDSINRIYQSMLDEAFRKLTMDRETVLHKNYGKLSPEEMHKMDMEEIQKNKEKTKQEQEELNKYSDKKLPSQNQLKNWKGRRTKQIFLKMVTHPYYVQNISKKLGVLLDKKRAERGKPPIMIDIIANTQHGMSLNFVKELRDQIKPAKDAITLVISATGDPPTAWILAHNIAHKLIGNENITDPDFRKKKFTPEELRQKINRENQELRDYILSFKPEDRLDAIREFKQKKEAERANKKPIEVPRITKEINPTLLSVLHDYQEAYFKSKGIDINKLTRNKQGLIKDFYMNVSGFKSVREDNLQLEVEYLFELMAEYIIKGEAKFLPVPNEKVANYYARQLTDLFDNLMDEAVGTIIWS